VYSWIWRTLPGGLPGKLTGSLVLLVAAVLLLLFVIFPAVEPLLPFNDVTVDVAMHGAVQPAVDGASPGG
jgi:hypothetical protein